MKTYYFFIPWNSHVGIHMYQYVLVVKPGKNFLQVWYTWFLLIIWIAGWYNKVHMVLRFPVFGHVRSQGGGGTFFFDPNSGYVVYGQPLRHAKSSS